MVGAAAASHSHNYAGADSAGGAAKEVKSWGAASDNVARHVWFSNNGADNQRVYSDNFKYNPVENVVSCNISGTANVAKSLNGTVRYVTTDDTSKPYWRCLKLESRTDWLDGSVILCVDSGYENGGFGILAVRFRNNNVSESAVATHGTVQWLCRYGYEPDQFILKIYSAKSTVGYADLYFHATGQYNSCNIRILANSTRGVNDSSWQLMNDEPRAAMDTRAYTAQVTGCDVGKVAYASSAGSANAVAWGNVSGKPSTYAPSSHTHDDRYYTESEVNTKLNGKANSSHTHDDRYYTESEVNTKLNGKANSSHTHDDRYYTESEMNTKLNAKAASDIVTISSTKPTSDTCQLWVKI